ncbi:MAG TPA: HD-GYP domain-containing protein [Solirubrobacteraceae bacterium]|nr:HD-GYP domain-containing protein [Solirubrobacteraceae bacterium]
MRLAPLSEVPDGVTVGRDVLAGMDRAPLLRAGVTLTPDYREGLVRSGVHAIYVEDRSSAGIVPARPLIGEETQALAARVMADAYSEARSAFETRRPLDPEVAETLTTVLEVMLDEIKSHGEAAVALRDMCAADAYTFQHSIDVTALGMLVGAHFFAAQGWRTEPVGSGPAQIDERLLILGLGLLLHDIGKLAVPTPILQKPGPLTQDERDLIENHPQAGFDLLAGNSWSPLVKAIVLRHHERWNGSGYPDGLRGHEIHPMARIAAVADVYDAVTSERPYAAARPAHEGLQIITGGAGTQFDPGVVDVFAGLVAPFPPGVEVKLNDGRRALVVEVPSDTLDRPLVRVIDNPDSPYELALASEPEVGIEGWDEPVRLSA